MSGKFIWQPAARIPISVSESFAVVLLSVWDKQESITFPRFRVPDMAARIKWRQHRAKFQHGSTWRHHGANDVNTGQRDDWRHHHNWPGSTFFGGHAMLMRNSSDFEVVLMYGRGQVSRQLISSEVKRKAASMRCKPFPAGIASQHGNHPSTSSWCPW
jgi:hypothetical protein